MRWMLAPWVLTIGCGAQDLEPAQFQSDAVAIACARAFACCDADERRSELASLGRMPADEAECRDLLGRRFAGQGGIEASVRAGRARYDAERARACLDEIAAAECDEWAFHVLDIASVSGACGAALTPLLEDGALCTHDYECSSSMCDTGGIGDGQCAVLPTAGEPCATRCATGSVCSGGSCIAPLGPGAACTSGGQCESGDCERGSCTAMARCDGLP